MEAERVSHIDMTPDDLLAANMAALGIVEGPRNTTADRVLEAYTAYIAEHKRAPKATDIAPLVGTSVSSVRAACGQLANEGRMLRYVDRATGQNAYIPKVV